MRARSARIQIASGRAPAMSISDLLPSSPGSVTARRKTSHPAPLGLALRVAGPIAPGASGDRFWSKVRVLVDAEIWSVQGAILLSLALDRCTVKDRAPTKVLSQRLREGDGFISFVFGGGIKFCKSSQAAEENRFRVGLTRGTTAKTQ